MNELLDDNPFVMFKIPGCTNCTKMAEMFNSVGLEKNYSIINLADLDNMDDVLSSLKETTKTSMFPMIFINKKFIGSYKEVKQMIEFGTFGDILKNELNITLTIDV